MKEAFVTISDVFNREPALVALAVMLIVMFIFGTLNAFVRRRK